MSLTPAMIDAMLSAGCTAEQIAAVVKADMLEREGQAVTKRTRDAERQRRHRHAVSRDVTVTACDSVTNPSPPPPLSPQTPLTPPPPHPDKQTRARKGTRLQADWTPEPLSGDTGQAVQSWPVGAIERELSRFRDWAASATGKNAIKSDWQAAWRNWIRKAQDEGRYGKPIRSHGAADHRSSRLRAIDEALEHLGP